MIITKIDEARIPRALAVGVSTDVYGRKEANDIVYGNINDALSDLNDTLKEQIDRLEAYDNR